MITTKVEIITSPQTPMEQRSYLQIIPSVPSTALFEIHFKTILMRKLFVTLFLRWARSVETRVIPIASR